MWEQEIRDSERAAEESRRRLVAFVSHDLRTPLAGIRAVVRGHRRRRRHRTTRSASHAKHIEQESIRLSEMVDDLFEMSKINAGAMQPAYDKVALDEVVDDVMAAHRDRRRAGRRGADGGLPTEPVRVVGSDRALVRVLSNLVANAIAHTPEGGTVELALGCRRERRVGPRRRHRGRHRRGGPAAGVRRRLPRLQRTGCHGTDASLPSGSGLGLAIAAGLVQAHHGTLSARNLDTGARFEVRLPLARLTLVFE